MLRCDDIRRLFIEFFQTRPGAGGAGHTFVPSSPAVPLDDPTLLFTNAGMNQFKPLFLGQADPSSAIGKLARAVNSQKCIRAGGKHNDLDDVGKDTYHHTFFEMLGNWSFGDYFKKESIDWAWELLTKVYGIAPDRLYASYFGGHAGSGLAPDLEARELWLRYLPDSRIIPGSMKDNFWEMGDTGPCGPCSEIHVDRIGGRDASSLVNTGDPDVIEIWNLVFIQFNREEGGALKPLPARHVDTGMGFERLTSVLQNVRSNYDTDIFLPLFAAIERVTGARKPYTGKVGAADKDNTDTAYRVIADHIRTLTIALTDGAVPSNEGRGYVLRRILRRAVRYGRQTLGAKTGFFAQLVPVVVERMGGFFPELKADPARVQEIIREEEESFGRTLERGCVLFDEACVRAFAKARLTPHLQAAGAAATAKRLDGAGAGWALQIDVPGNANLSGAFRPAEMSPAWADAYFGPNRSLAADDAFKLYDTYGFPVDLTALMAEERGLKVDLPGYEALMHEARERARAGGGGKFALDAKELSLPGDAVARLRHMGVPPTDDVDKFHGRDIRATVRALWDGSDFAASIDAATLGVRAVGVILDKTNFYAEMGGQVGDQGRMVVSRESKQSVRDDSEPTGGGEFRVEDAQVYAGYVVHVGRLGRRELRVGDEVTLTLDGPRRASVAGHHTATHLLNLGLARTLGGEVNQRGSLVAPDKLRFDFSHPRPVAPEEVARVEGIVRDQIALGLTVFAEPAPLAEARKIPGVRAVFGEAYPDPVRVVSIGTPVPMALKGGVNTPQLERSIEFCGGTHVNQTGDIGAFTITSEEAVAKGVRRVTAVAGVAAQAALAAAEGLRARLAGTEHLGPAELAGEVASLLADLERLTLPLVARHALRASVTALQEKLKVAQKAAAAGRVEQVVATARAIADSPEWDSGSCITTSIDAGSDREALLAAVNAIRQKRPRSAVLLVSPDAESDKLTIMASVPEAIIKRGLAAGEWVKAAAAACGGKGGGRPDAAQAGGTGAAKLRECLDAAQAYAFSKVPV